MKVFWERDFCVMRMKRICGVLLCASLLASSLTPSATAYAVGDEAVLEASEEASFESSFDKEEEAADEAASLESVSDEADEEKTEEISETEEESLAETEDQDLEGVLGEDASEETVDEEGESTEDSDEASFEESSEAKEADAAASADSSFAEETATEEEDKDLFGAGIDWESIEPNSIGFYLGGIALITEDSLAGGRGDVYASTNVNGQDAIKIGTAELFEKSYGRQVDIMASEFGKGTYYLFAKYYDKDGNYVKSSPNTITMYVEGAPEYTVTEESSYKAGDGKIVITSKPGKYDRIYCYQDGTENCYSFKDKEEDGVFEIDNLSSGVYRFSLIAEDSSDFAGPFYAGTELTKVIVPLEKTKYTSIMIQDGEHGYTINSEQSLYVGDMLPLYTYTKPSSYVYPAIAWASDNEKVAYVDENNMLRALSVGTTTITVSLVDDPSVSSSFPVEVKDAPAKKTYRSIKTFKTDKSKISGKPGEAVTVKLTTDKELYSYVSQKAEKRLFKWYLVDDSGTRARIDGSKEIYSSVDENGQSSAEIKLPDHGAYSLKVETIAYISDGGFLFKSTEIPVYVNGYQNGHIYKDGKRITGWANVDKDGNLLSAGKIDSAADTTYYADSSCKVVTGNYKIGKILYSFDANGKLIGTVLTGWQKDASGEYYVDPKTGEKAVNAWILKGKNYVHVGKDGICDSFGKTGLFESDRIYCVKDGVRVTGFVFADASGNYFVKAKDASVAYYFDPACGGAMTTGFFSLKNKRYYANDDGVITLSDIFKAGSNLYYADGQGVIQTSKYVTGKDGNGYYAGSDGKLLVNGYATVSGKICFFGSDGRIVTDQTKWTADGLVSKNGKRYFIENGKILTDVGFHEIGDTNEFIYVKDKTGALATGIYSAKINGQTRKYIFTDEGLLYMDGMESQGLLYKNKLYLIWGGLDKPTNVKEAEEFYIVILSKEQQSKEGFKQNSDGSCYSGMGKLKGKKCYYYLGTPMPKVILTISGKTYCFGPDGTMQTGWVKISGYSYCNMSTGATSIISSTDRNAWCYFNTGSGAAACGWKKMKAPAIDGNGSILYRTDSSGEDEIVLTTTTKNLYFSDVVGYKKIKGQLVRNQDIVINGKQYRLGADGAPETGACGMAYREGDNYDEFYMRSYLKADGSFATGRTAVTEGGRTEYYYFSTANYEVEERVLRKTGKKWYYYGDHGRMSYYLRATYLDKNDVYAKYNSDGSIKGFVYSGSDMFLKNCRIVLKDSEEEYYLGKDGMPVTGNVSELDKKLYYDTDGRQLGTYSGLKKVGKKIYYFEKGVVCTTGKPQTIFVIGDEIPAADKAKIAGYLAAVSCTNESGIGLLTAISAADGSMCAGTRILDGRTVHTNRYGIVMEQMSPFFRVGSIWYVGDCLRNKGDHYYDTGKMPNFYTMSEDTIRIRWDDNYKITSVTVLENDEDTGKPATGVYYWGYSMYGDAQAYVCFKNGKIQTGNITLYKFLSDKKAYFDPDTGLSCDPTGFNYN